MIGSIHIGDKLPTVLVVELIMNDKADLSSGPLNIGDVKDLNGSSSLHDRDPYPIVSGVPAAVSNGSAHAAPSALDVGISAGGLSCRELEQKGKYQKERKEPAAP